MFHYADVLYGDLDPSRGHEQTKRRPLIVVSNDSFNARSNMTFVVPVTSTDNGYPLHVDIGMVDMDNGDVIEGFACVEQAKSLDMYARKGVVVGRMSHEVMQDITDKLLACLLTPTQVVR
ncbi:MAG: type II toxin-antitoxin system PemK/MazF family toxin [Actinomycetaceae bacterium]|nr:type II toxin-antitoxin system PemK/MazF family toxin [Actinomycetaceae bacterium]